MADERSDAVPMPPLDFDMIVDTAYVRFEETIEFTDGHFDTIDLPKECTKALAAACSAYGAASHYLKAAGLQLRQIADNRKSAVEMYKDSIVAALKLGLNEKELMSLDVKIGPKPDDFIEEPEEITAWRALRQYTQNKLRRCLNAILDHAFPPIRVKRANSKKEMSGAEAKEKLKDKPAPGAAASNAGGSNAGAGKGGSSKGGSGKGGGGKGAAAYEEEAEEAAAGNEDEYEDDSDGGDSVGADSTTSGKSKGVAGIMTGDSRPSSAGSTGSAGKRRRRGSGHPGTELGRDAIDALSEENARLNQERAGAQYVLRQHAQVVRNIRRTAEEALPELEEAMKDAAALDAPAEISQGCGAAIQMALTSLVAEFDKSGNLVSQTAQRPWAEAGAPRVSFPGKAKASAAGGSGGSGGQGFEEDDFCSREM